MIADHRGTGLVKSGLGQHAETLLGQPHGIDGQLGELTSDLHRLGQHLPPLGQDIEDAKLIGALARDQAAEQGHLHIVRPA